MSTAPASVDGGGRGGGILAPPATCARERRNGSGHQRPQRPQDDGGADPDLPGPAGNPGGGPRTLEGLARIQLAHKIAVPFENLDIVAGRPLSLDLNHLYDKIVVRRQGRVRGAEHPVQLAALLPGVPGGELQRPDALPGHLPLPPPPDPGGGAGGKDLHHRRGLCHGERPPPLELVEGTVQSDGHCEYRYQWEPFFGWVQSQRRPGVTGRKFRPLPWNPRSTGTLTPCSSSLKRAPESNMNQFPPPLGVHPPRGMLALRRHTYRVERQGLVVSSTPVTPRRRRCASPGRSSTWTPRGCELRKYRTQRPGRGYPSAGRFS